MADELGNTLATFYDRQMIKMATANDIFPPEKIVGYRMVRVPRIFHLPIPVIKWQTDGDCYECYTETGILITSGTIKIRLGSKMERQPIYEREKGNGSVIKFKRYSPLDLIGKVESAKANAVSDYNKMGEKYCDRPRKAVIKNDIIYERKARTKRQPH